GHLDEEQLARAFRTQQETKVRLGKVLAMVHLAHRIQAGFQFSMKDCAFLKGTSSI
ncbi:MAG: hypothetical protein HGB11_10695, partial [Chlorobiales bacterium]|nr:hypothetical protein [Chlorobiales bacterium]